ncbi:MAG: DUF1735 domain-containing protein [Ferruginibacter sp.]
MKYFNVPVRLLALTLMIAGFAACKKAVVADPLGDRGQTVVKVMNGGDEHGYWNKILNGIDFVNTTQTIDVCDIRRDANSNAELNRAFNAIVKDDTAAIRIYNDSNGTSIIPMPRDWYTVNIQPSAVGGNYTIPFAAGDFAKQIAITIPDATLLDPSSTYGLAFTLLSNDANFVNGAGKTLIYEIGAKNAFDGKYEVTGTFRDVANAAFVSDYPQEWHLITTGANSVDVYNESLGTVGYLFSNAGSGTYYGAFGLTMTFDPSTGAIADLHNYYGDPTKAATPGGNPAAGSGAPNYAASNGRRAVLDPSGVNAFSFSTHDIDIKYWMVQPSVVAVGPRSFFAENWRYIGPR